MRSLATPALPFNNQQGPCHLKLEQTCPQAGQRQERDRAVLQLSSRFEPQVLRPGSIGRTGDFGNQTLDLRMVSVNTLNSRTAGRSSLRGTSWNGIVRSIKASFSCVLPFVMSDLRALH